MAGTALLGAIVYTLSSFASTSAAVVYKDKEYNTLQNEVEKAKAALADKMKSVDSMECDLDKVKEALDGLVNSEGNVISADALVVYAHDDLNDKPFGMLPDVPWSHGDKAGVLRVRIYDMLYDVGAIAPREAFSLDADYEAFLADLPATLAFGGGSGQWGNANPEPLPERGKSYNRRDGVPEDVKGVYLVRAMLILNSGERKQIETAIVFGKDESEGEI